MATLLNTLLASLFPALFGAHQESIPVPEPSAKAEITVRAESEINCDPKIYIYSWV